MAVVRGTVLFIDCVTGNFFSVGKDKYVAQTGKEPSPGLQPTDSLPPEVLAALTSPANPETATQRALQEAPPDVCADYTLVSSLLDRVSRERNVTGTNFTTAPSNPPVFTPGTELTCASQPCS